MSINEFSDLSDEEVERTIQFRSGIKLPHSGNIRPFTVEEVHQIEESITHRLQAANVPEELNWFERGAVSIPYSQGGCGSCWAFSASAALESLAKLSGFD